MHKKRVLAIIPVCEGAAALPNKNMRIVHGKPMVYYAIHNALSSKYIADVIVSTNAPEVISLAKQLGAKIRIRNSNLCNPNISLDEVVFDVFNELSLHDYDYVVTLQSISPTLKSTTLDLAFQRMFDNNYDTLISVANKAQFYWTLNNGKACPTEPKRMNRHCLPPFYKETGAFLITKASCISPESRIGNNVGLFELNDDEAIDVNTFGDLYQVNKIMERKNTAIFVHGNNIVGMGHISRVHQIADDLFTKPDIYFDKNVTSIDVFGQSPYPIFAVVGNAGFIDAVSKKNYDIIINDVLSTTSEFMTQLRSVSPNTKIINFEDEGNGARYADVVINALYENSEYENVRFGSEYYIIPKQFLIYEPVKIKEKVLNVLVSFGGADPCGYTEQLLDIVNSHEFDNINFVVVLGGAKAKAHELLINNNRQNINILFNIDNMAEIMSKCDVAITSRGRTCYELAFLGIPTISLAQNEREQRHSFASEKNGFDYLGMNPSKDIIKTALNNLIFSSKEKRITLQNKMLNQNLKNGRANISNIING